jgi:hypothetical protein
MTRGSTAAARASVSSISSRWSGVVLSGTVTGATSGTAEVYVPGVPFRLI